MNARFFNKDFDPGPSGLSEDIALLDLGFGRRPLYSESRRGLFLQTVRAMLSFLVSWAYFGKVVFHIFPESGHQARLLFLLSALWMVRGESLQSPLAQAQGVPHVAAVCLASREGYRMSIF